MLCSTLKLKCKRAWSFIALYCRENGTMALTRRPQLASHRNLSHLLYSLALPHIRTRVMKFSAVQQCAGTTNAWGGKKKKCAAVHEYGGFVWQEVTLWSRRGGSQINSIRQRCFNKNCELTVSSLKATEWGQKFASLDWWHSLRFLVFSRTGPRLSYLLVHVPYTSVYEERSHLIGQYISE